MHWQHRFRAGARLRLELEQHLQRALRDLRLVRRISGQELTALDQVIHAGGHMMPVCTAAKEERNLTRNRVLAGELGHVPFDRQLGCVIGQASNRARQSRLLGHVHEQVVDGGCADHGQHCVPVGLGQGKVAQHGSPADGPFETVTPARCRGDAKHHSLATNAS
jgi:hypothetical protein